MINIIHPYLSSNHVKWPDSSNSTKHGKNLMNNSMQLTSLPTESSQGPEPVTWRVLKPNPNFPQGAWMPYTFGPFGKVWRDGKQCYPKEQPEASKKYCQVCKFPYVMTHKFNTNVLLFFSVCPSEFFGFESQTKYMQAERSFCQVKMNRWSFWHQQLPKSSWSSEWPMLIRNSIPKGTGMVWIYPPPVTVANEGFVRDSLLKM